MLENSDLEHACLYAGSLAAEMPDLSPWLIRLDPTDTFMRKLCLSVPPEDLVAGQVSPPWAMWDRATVLFIRSRRDFDALRAHLRRYTAIRREQGETVMLRFWDPLIFEDAMTAYGPAGLVGLFRHINSFVVYHSHAALRRDFDGEVPAGRVQISTGHRETYVRLRRARLGDAACEHFMKLPDFQNDDRDKMRTAVDSYLSQARRIGLREAADMHQLALGLALSRGDDAFRTEQRKIYDCEDVTMRTRRNDIMQLVRARIDLARGTAASLEEACA